MTALTGTIVVAPRWCSGYEYTAVGSYALGGAIASADTITWTTLLPQYNDVQILGLRFWGQELDTNASPTGTIIIGDGTTTNNYLESLVCGNTAAAPAQLDLAGNGVVIGASTYASKNIVATIGGTIGTAASSGTVWVSVRYYCQTP